MRKDRALTQADLAMRVGIQQSDLCRMETGEYKVSLESLFKILKIFEMNIAEFFHLTTTADVTPGEQEILSMYRTLPHAAREQVREFIYFKGTRARRTRRSTRSARR
ncbi:MAG: helix-turn-helix transcriptional regulator [Acidobacteria bacterium]|nr:helix-turn-helix transcriptional regulator [Acidobacteriota bacterium]